jgi:hypothetical protein
VEYLFFFGLSRRIRCFDMGHTFNRRHADGPSPAQQLPLSLRFAQGSVYTAFAVSMLWCRPEIRTGMQVLLRASSTCVTAPANQTVTEVIASKAAGGTITGLCRLTCEIYLVRTGS